MKIILFIKTQIKYISINYYSVEPIVAFNQAEWDLQIFGDSGQQKDGESCGLYFISSVFFILSNLKLCVIDDLNRMWYWVKNLIEEFYIEQDRFDTIDTIKIVHFEELIESEVKIERSDPYLVNLLHEINQDYSGNKCDYDECEGVPNRNKNICVQCRRFYHLDHHLFHDTKSFIFFVCTQCFIDYDL